MPELNRPLVSGKLTGIGASIAALIDHTLLRPDATAADIARRSARCRLAP